MLSSDSMESENTQKSHRHSITETISERIKQPGNLSTIKAVLACIALPTAFILIGASIFEHLEYPSEVTRLEAFAESHASLNQTLQEIAVALNDTGHLEKYEEFIDQIELYLYSKASVPDESNPFWDFKGSAYFAFTIMTTIGYGTYSPATISGKVFCIFYTFLTVPLYLVALAVLSEHIGKAALKVFSRFKSNGGSDSSQWQLLIIWILGICMIFLLSIAYSQEESGWSYLDAVYFSVITLSTVGLGDYTPTLESEHIFLFILYCAFGMLIVGSMISSLQQAFDKSSEVVSRQLSITGKKEAVSQQLRKSVRNLKLNNNQGSHEI